MMIAFFRRIPLITQIRVLQGYPCTGHHHGGGCPLCHREACNPPLRKEVTTMIDIDTVIAIITLAVTATGLGLQIASYINLSKNDRPSSRM